MRRSTRATRHNGSALTERETEVVRLLVMGLRNRAIGEKLSITEGTVKIHLHTIYEKLNLDSRLGLALYAHAKRLV
jgi:two-component system, NarL family, nitrate/nitrite response regulator NarL